MGIGYLKTNSITQEKGLNFKCFSLQNVAVMQLRGAVYRLHARPIQGNMVIDLVIDKINHA